MSDHNLMARRVTIHHQVATLLPLAERDARCCVDIPQSFARRRIVLGERCGTIDAALACGDDEMLATALAYLQAAAQAWLEDIANEAAR